MPRPGIPHRSLVDLRALGPVGRRSFLRGTAVGGAALGLPALLAACGTEGTVQTAESCESTDSSETEKVVNFSNWPEYIDVQGKRNLVMTFGGGVNEIQRELIAVAGLGLPRVPR